MWLVKDYFYDCFESLQCFDTVEQDEGRPAYTNLAPVICDFFVGEGVAKNNSRIEVVFQKFSVLKFNSKSVNINFPQTETAVCQSTLLVFIHSPTGVADEL